MQALISSESSFKPVRLLESLTELNKAFADRARHLSTTAKVPHPWEFFHDQIGWNDRMPNINAALGCAQLEKIEKSGNFKQGCR